MEPFVIRKTAAERADVLPVRSRKQQPARVRYPPVVVCTGLPPLVDGQIRCFVKLTIRRIRLVQAELCEQNDFVIRVKWWGEPSDGAYFKPICGRRRSGRQITARYAVRCGPKQFSAYLMDAGALTMELLAEGIHDKVWGVANITDIVNLSVQRPVIGWYKLLAIGTHKHVADVHVNISFCELQDIYGESSGTGTGTEVSQDESDGSSQVDGVRPYRVETGFLEEKKSNQNSGRVSFQQDLVESTVPILPGNYRSANSSASVANEVDRLIERAELLKLLISPDPGHVSVSAHRPVSELDFDADNSLSDTSLIADLFYGKNKISKNKVDTSVQVTPDRPLSKKSLRSPSVSPVKSPVKSPRFFETRKVASPKVVKFVDMEQKRATTRNLVHLLKRARGVVVAVHTLRLSAGDYRHFVAGSIPRRQLHGISSSLSKPPRPLKITFFIHAQLPTGELCQLTRICGKADLETNVIDFDQSEAIPLALNENKIALWLESAAVTFRVSCRHASVNRTQPVGVSVFSLEALLTSENLKSRQNVALSSRNPGSALEVSLELHAEPDPEGDQEGDELSEEKADPVKPIQDSNKSPTKSPKRTADNKSPAVEAVPQPAPAVPLVVMFCVNEVEFFDSFVDRMSAAASMAQDVSGRDNNINRWEIYLTAAAFSQPRRSSARRSVTMIDKQSVSFSPKLQLYYVYNLDLETAARFEDNHLVVELRRHTASEEEDQVLAICKVSLHQLYLAFGCDPVATSAVMRSPGPIVSVNNEFLPADDPSTLAPVARMRCTLAAGSADQIAHFNALTSHQESVKLSQEPCFTKERHSDRVNSDDKSTGRHRLTLAITELDQLYVPADFAGEKEADADVFVAYQFPTNLGLRGGSAAARPEVKTFKTPLRSYRGPEASISFGNDVANNHEFSAIDSSNLLADLVRSFSFLSSHSSTLGIDFVVSVRLYKPIVRDVIVGFATMSLTRLASLITSSKSSRHRQHIFVRLPVTPNGQQHTVGWLTVRLDFSSSGLSSKSASSAGSPVKRSSRPEEPIGSVRISVRRACGLRSAAKRLGLRVSSLSSSSSIGFKTYCAVKTSQHVIKSECDVADRSFCPVFRVSQFDLSPKGRQPHESVEVQLFARDRRQGDLLVGTTTVPAGVIDTLIKFRPRSTASLTLPLCCEEAMTTSEFLMENVVGCVDVDVQLPVSSNNYPATIPNWFHAEPRAKISLYVDKIVVALPMSSGRCLDDVFRCRLSIGDSFSSPLSISVSRPISSTYIDEDVLVISTAPDSIVLEHAVPSPPLSEVVDYLARCTAKVEVQFSDMLFVAFVPLVQLLASQAVPGQFPLVTPNSADYFGACIFARVSVEALSATGSLKDRITGRSSIKKESDCFVASVGVSRALHLAQHLLDEQVYISVAAAEPLRTHSVPSGDRPIWNFSAECFIPKELIQGSSGTSGLVFRLLTTSNKTVTKLEDDPVVGCATVDLTSLSRGIGSVSGWYHLLDAFGHCLGQILVSVQPIEEVYQPPQNKERCSSALIVAPQIRRHSADVQTDFEIVAPILPPVPPAVQPSVPTQITQQPSAAAGFDMEQLEQLSKRIARLLTDPLPPRFPTNENFTSTDDLGLPHTRVEPPKLVDDYTETDSNFAYPSTETARNKVSSSSSRSKVSSKSTSSSSSTSSRLSSSSNGAAAKVATSSKPPSFELPRYTESPDPVELLFEVDKILKSVESPRPSSALRPIISSVDESLFATVTQCGPSNSNNVLKVNYSGEFGSEDDKFHQLTMSPSVLEHQQEHHRPHVIEEVVAEEPQLHQHEPQRQDSSRGSSPPPLELMSHASTEEWSHSCGNDTDMSRKIDEVLAYGGDSHNNLTVAENAVGDWSTILAHQLDSPDQSSSPVSSNIYGKGENITNEEATGYDFFSEQLKRHSEQQSPSSNTPRLEETITREKPSDDIAKRRQRRSPPAWLSEANAKLSSALPSFFPHPDALKMALERVRTQRGETSFSDPTTPRLDASTTSTRRVPPTFDVEEARRIAKIFSSDC